MFCPNCGMQLPDTAQFCPNCGTRLSAPPAQGAPQATPSDRPPQQFPQGDPGRQNLQRPQSPQGQMQNVQRPAGTPKAPVKSRGTALIAGILIFITILIALLIGGIMLLRTRSNRMRAGESVPPVSSEASAESTPSGGNDIPATPVVTATPTPKPTPEPLVGFDAILGAAISAAGGVSIDLITVDVAEYPDVKLYYSVKDREGDACIMTSPTAGIREALPGGDEIEREIRSIERLEGNEGIGFDILVDKSSSMEYDMPQVQRILTEFIQSMDYASGDAAEIISFDSYLMYMCTFTNDVSNLLNGISNMTPYGMTALYDALYTGVENAGLRTGANCVIAFTDGMDNVSVHTWQEVINLANEKEIPVYLIGTDGADAGILADIASKTGGFYWSLGSIGDMDEILQRIYREQKNMYCITYASDSSWDPYAERYVSCAIVDADNRDMGASSMKTPIKPAKRADRIHHDSRYELIAGDVSWTEANDECIRRGGHLVTIGSQQEMDEMVRMAEAAGLKYVWIGGYTSVRDNVAYGHWVTGEPFSYTAWYPGEPSRNDADGTPEFYLMLWKVGDEWSWNDQRNDVITNTGFTYFIGKTGYICEYEE